MVENFLDIDEERRALQRDVVVGKLLIASAIW